MLKPILENDTLYALTETLHSNVPFTPQTIYDIAALAFSCTLTPIGDQPYSRTYSVSTPHSST
jgi:hypothetical protein